MHECVKCVSVCLQDEPERAKRLSNRWGKRGSCPLHEGSLPIENSPPSAVCLLVLTRWSLSLPVNSWNNTHLHVHLPGQAKLRQGSVGRPIYSAAEGSETRRAHRKWLPQGQIKPISHHPARLCSSQTLIGHGRRVKRTNFHRHFTTEGRWEERR